jgi:predicted RNase H-like nuclease
LEIPSGQYSTFAASRATLAMMGIMKTRKNETMLFLGLDLAWGAKNTSGGCALWLSEDEKTARVLDVAETLGDDDAIMGWIERWDRETGGDGLLLGIDAPLLVPNQTGRRPCEAEIGRQFARYQAGAHPANRTLFKNDVRGERLVTRLAARQIRHDPFLIGPRAFPARQVMEVFPHPAHIRLFGLERTLKYKAKPGRDYAGRWAAMNDYARHLRKLETHAPPLRLPPDWPPDESTGLVGTAFKRREDGMDALTCAYICYWYWWHGRTGADVIGDMTAGYIVVPQANA